jgi:hypothetical protein
LNRDVTLDPPCGLLVRLFVLKGLMLHLVDRLLGIGDPWCGEGLLKTLVFKI